MKSLIFKILFFFSTITLIINCTQVNNHIEPVNDNSNLTGTWLGIGYQCPLGTFHIEQIAIEDDGVNIKGTKITGDACVTANTITFSGTKNDSTDAYQIIWTTGNSFIPNSSTADGTLTKIDNNTLYASSSTQEEITFTRINSKVKFWINAFIPKDIGGYTQAAPSPYIGQTMIQYSIPLNPGNINQYCALTDNRTYSSDFLAQHRMQSSIELIYHGNDQIQIFTDHDIDPSHEIICTTGLGGCFDVGSTNDMEWKNYSITGNKISIDLVAKANNPCSIGNGWSPNIDYKGSLIVDFGNKVLSFEGKIDDFPAFEAYARIDNGDINTLLQKFDETKTVLDLIGGPSNAISGQLVW